MEDFAKERLEICKACGLYLQGDIGAKCNSKKWLNPETNETSFFKKDGWIKGCGCLLVNRTSNINNRCVAGKW